MTTTLLDSPAAVRRTGGDFIAEASEAAATARVRAQVARLLVRRSERSSGDPAHRSRELRHLRREALAYERDAECHDEAVAAMRELVAVSVATGSRVGVSA